MATDTAPLASPPNRRLSGGNRRLSGGGRRLSGWRPEDVENFFDENDDEKEREAAAEQRKAEQLAKEKTRSPFRETPSHQKRRQIYTDCIQMAAEDRVNAQNSWHLDLIDHMGHMIAEPSVGGTDASGQPNFQMASTTLDAGVKIYSYRVDSVFNQTFKLVGGLNRTSRKDGAEEDDAGAADGVPGDGEAEGGEEGVTGNEDEKKKKFDEGGANGLLLNNLAVHRSCELVFDSTDALTDAPSAARVPAAPLPAGVLAGLIPAAVSTGHVAKEFVDFWASVHPSGPAAADGDDEDEDVENDAEEENATDDVDVEPAPTTLPILDEDYAPDEPAAIDDDDYDEDVAAREAMLAAQEGALGVDEEGAAAFMSLDEFAQENERRASLGGAAAEPIEVLAPEVAAARGLLSAHAQKLLHIGQRWAGPGHWKFRAPAASSKGAGGGGEAKGRKAKASFLIDFSQGARLTAGLEEAPSSAKGATQLTAAALAKAKAAETTLPHDYHCNIDALENLFDRPSHRVSYATRLLQRKKAGAVATAAQQEETPTSPAPVTSFDGTYADDFDHDDGFGGAGDVDDDHDDPAMGVGGDEVGADGTGDASAGGAMFEFVPAPTRVAKIDIGYAKRAKQVDIKALKEDLWVLLQEEGGQGKGKGKSKSGAAAPQEVSFQTVLGRLHERMPADKLHEVSFAYCFICLLHLANEKSLEVLGDGGDMKDMKVRLPAAS